MGRSHVLPKKLNNLLKYMDAHNKKSNECMYSVNMRFGGSQIHRLNSQVFTCLGDYCTQKMKFSIKDFFSKCDQICNFQRILSHLLKKSLMENFIFWVVIELSST